MVEKGLKEKDKSRQERKELAIKQNIQVLSRYFSGIRSILFYAHNVCVYDFDEANKCWKRSEIEGAFHIVDTVTEIPYRIIVLNRRELENLALDIVPGWTQFEEVKGTIQLQSPQGKIYALWFFDEEEEVEAVKVLSSLLNQQKAPQKDCTLVSQRPFEALTKANNDLYVQQTPEKEILRLLKSPVKSEETTYHGVESSPLSQKQHQVLSPGRVGSPFPSSSNFMKNISKSNYTTFVETARSSLPSPPSVDAGKQILSLLKHVESISLSDAGVVNDTYSSGGGSNSRNSSFNLSSCGHELTQSNNTVKDYSAPQLQAALQVLANNAPSNKELWKGSQTGEIREIADLIKKLDWKDPLPSAGQLKELLSTILQDDALFQQFYVQYIETIKSNNTKI